MLTTGFLSWVVGLIITTFINLATCQEHYNHPKYASSSSSLTRRCTYVDDGFLSKDCGFAPTPQMMADFFKKQAADVLQLAQDFPCGFTSCPKFKRDLEFHYQSRFNEPALENYGDPKSNSDMLSNNISSHSDEFDKINSSQGTIITSINESEGQEHVNSEIKRKKNKDDLLNFEFDDIQSSSVLIPKLVESSKDLPSMSNNDDEALRKSVSDEENLGKKKKKTK